METKQPLNQCSINTFDINKFINLPFYENIRIDLNEEYNYDDIDEMLMHSDYIYLPSLLIIQYDNLIIDYYKINDDNTVEHLSCDASLNEEL